jgi:type IV pilus assembly protein PilW
MNTRTSTIQRERGFTLIELMISLTLGLLVLAGLVSVFVNSSRANREHHRSAEQIENGRYATDVLMNDLHHAGYYGEFFKLPDTAPFPDPCALSDAAGQITQSLPYAVQGFDAPNYSAVADLSGTTCATWLPNANLEPGSDVLVVRRGETAALAIGDIAIGDIAQAKLVYLQANPFNLELQIGSGVAITSTSRADGTTAVVTKRDGVTGADIRKFVVHVYFVAPCSVPAGGGVTCTGAADDGGRPIPTLKRLELGVAAGATTMRIETISEGIESIQVDYGIDSLPGTKNSITGVRGDGAPDTYTAHPASADFMNAVTARVHLLARNTEPTVGYVDTKTYRLGLAGDLGPFNDTYKRHVYTGTVRMINTSGRREIPQ